MRSLNILILSICILLLSISAHGQSSIPPSSYAFITGLEEDGNVDIYNLDYSGGVSFKSRTDLWSLTPRTGNAWTQMMDPWDVALSPNGKYAFFYDFNGRVGAIFSVDNQFQLNLIKMQNYGCGGAGFTQDGEYCFSSNSFNLREVSKPTMNIYKVNGGKFDLVKSQSVPTTGCLGVNYISNSKDEIISTAVNGYLSSWRAINVYQFNRSSEELNLKYRWDSTPDNVVQTSSAKGGDLIVEGQGYVVRSIARQSDGSYKYMSKFWKLPEWRYADCAPAARITSDAKYAVVCIQNLSYADCMNGGGGAALFSIKPNGELQYLSTYILYNARALDFTPDNRFVVVAYEGGLKLAVFKINQEQGVLDKVSEIPHTSPGVFVMRFFPQYYPKTPVEEKSWQLYGNINPKSPSIPRLTLKQ